MTQMTATKTYQTIFCVFCFLSSLDLMNVSISKITHKNIRRKLLECDGMNFPFITVKADPSDFFSESGNSHSWPSGAKDGSGCASAAHGEL